MPKTYRLKSELIHSHRLNQPMKTYTGLINPHLAPAVGIAFHGTVFIIVNQSGFNCWSNPAGGVAFQKKDAAERELSAPVGLHVH